MAKFTPNPGFKVSLMKQERKFLEEVGRRWQDYAESRVPVLTGYLRSQLEYRIGEIGKNLILQAGVGDHVPYALIQELRRSFIYSSFVDALSEAREILNGLSRR